MKECLYCEKPFEPKRDSAKYCSTSCRVMYNRKVDKATKKISATVIHNQTMEALAEMKEMRKQMTADLFMFGQARSDGKPLHPNIKHDTLMSVIPVDDEPLSFDKLRQEIVPQMTGKPPKTVDLTKN